jgi:cellulose synthase/poly-beta-1,6-N-acetylglucosamine synthase-like glycosyltransferase
MKKGCNEGDSSAEVRTHHDVGIAGEEIFRVIDQFARKQSEPMSGLGYTISRSGLNGPSVPKVSVIVPNYNHALYLRQRMDSIVNQTFQDFEVIVLDDASTDYDREIIKRMLTTLRFGFL